MMRQAKRNGLNMLTLTVASVSSRRTILFTSRSSAVSAAQNTKNRFAQPTMCLYVVGAAEKKKKQGY
jgi:hypothetical protein